MKPAPFDYVAVRSIGAALAALGPGARVLAGGQSLVPLLNAREIRPRLLVDVNGVAELDGIRRDGDALWIGATTRQAALERDPLVAAGWPLLSETVRHVGHLATRTRGTVGGSAAHAYPLAELPAALLALDARVHVRSLRGPRAIEAGAFFGGPGAALAADELLTAIEVPAPPRRSRAAFVEYSDTPGAPTLAGAAVVRAPGGRAAIAVTGAGPAPRRAREAERALADGAAPSEAAALAAAGADGAHRRAVLADTVRRAIEAARP